MISNSTRLCGNITRTLLGKVYKMVFATNETASMLAEFSNLLPAVSARAGARADGHSRLSKARFWAELWHLAVKSIPSEFEDIN